MSRASGPSRGRSSTLPSDYKIIYPPSEALQSAGTLPDGYPNKEAWLSAYTRPEDGGTTVVFSRRGIADLISYVPYSPANYQERVIFSARRRGQTATSLHNPLDHLSTVDLSSFAPSQTVTHESNAHQGKQREKGFFPIFNRLRQLSFDDLTHARRRPSSSLAKANLRRPSSRIIKRPAVFLKTTRS
ncbi:hypothetical protein I316_00498 [Kwoniella heveanensis BCC8398]|uniref:Uncharacterized protein n=1 Tax=Kwoniella heveanensis BCC8398 TaxID=1296120 RepID=A0A1B9H2A2_9TREE|nr:hypothetical protein I316_00498 [Kwoniella heveanensis BCC8398]